MSLRTKTRSSDEEGYSSVQSDKDGLLGEDGDEELADVDVNADDNDVEGSAFASYPNYPNKSRRKYYMMCAALFFMAIALVVFLEGGKGHKNKSFTAPEESYDWGEENAAATVSSKPALDEAPIEKPSKKKSPNEAKSKGDVFKELEVVEEEIQQLNNENEDTTGDDYHAKQEKEEEEDQLADLKDELIEEAIEKELDEGTLDYDFDFEAEADNLKEEIEEDVEDKQGGDDSDESYAEEKGKKAVDLMESASTSSVLQIKATAMTTIKKSHPNTNTGGQLHLSVEGDKKMSFIRFALPSVLGDEDVNKATLNLYSTSHHTEPIKVSIEALPHGGIWSDGSVSWNEQLESRDSFFVTSFEVKGWESGDRTQLYEVDVTSAISSKSKRITFKLSTESSGRLDFASEMWQEGKAVPELMVALSSNTTEPAKTDVFDKLQTVEEEILELENKHDDAFQQEKGQKEDELADLEKELIEEAIEEELREGTLDNDSDLEVEVENLEEEFEEDMEDNQGGGNNDESYAKEKVEEIEDILESASTANLLQVKATAFTTVKKSQPDVKTGGQLHLSVQGNERISFVRFELPSVLEDEEVIQATLNLYSTNHVEKPVKVSVRALPHSGAWSSGSVSWNDQLESRDSFFVNSFESKGSESVDKKQLYEVDVTSAIDSKTRRITFKLSTESYDRLDFASEMWQGGNAVPELMVAVSE